MVPIDVEMFWSLVEKVMDKPATFDVLDGALDDLNIARHGSGLIHIASGNGAQGGCKGLKSVELSGRRGCGFCAVQN